MLNTLALDWMDWVWQESNRTDVRSLLHRYVAVRTKNKKLLSARSLSGDFRPNWLCFFGCIDVKQQKRDRSIDWKDFGSKSGMIEVSASRRFEFECAKIRTFYSAQNEVSRRVGFIWPSPIFVHFRSLETDSHPSSNATLHFPVGTSSFALDSCYSSTHPYLCAIVQLTSFCSCGQRFVSPLSLGLFFDSLQWSYSVDESFIWFSFLWPTSVRTFHVREFFFKLFGELGTHFELFSSSISARGNGSNPHWDSLEMERWVYSSSAISWYDPPLITNFQNCSFRCSYRTRT